MKEFELPKHNTIQADYELKIERIFQYEDYTDNDINDALIDIKTEIESKILLYSFMLNTFKINNAKILHEAEEEFLASKNEDDEDIIFEFDTDFNSYDDIEHTNFNSPLFENKEYRTLVESIYKSKNLLDTCFEVKSEIEKLLHFDRDKFVSDLLSNKQNKVKPLSKGRLSRLELIMLFHQFIELSIFPKETEQADIAHMLKHIGFSFEKSEQEYSNYHSLDNKDLADRKLKIKTMLTELISAFD